MDVDHDIGLLVAGLKRIGGNYKFSLYSSVVLLARLLLKIITEKQSDGSYTTTFIKVFKDEVLEQQLESLVGTLKSARKKGLVDFQGQMLLQGASDNVVITLKP